MGRENITELFDRLKDVRGFKTGNGYDLDDIEAGLIVDEIEHLRAQLRNAGIAPMSEFICACGLRKSAPNVDKPNF